MKLSAKQFRFCQEYVIDLNAKQAAIRAGYSAKSAESKSCQLLQLAPVAKKVKQLQGRISDKLEISAEKVIQELAKIGFHNIQDYISRGNSISDLTKIERNKAAAVESITVIQTGSGKSAKKKTQVKMHDKVSALEKLGRHLGVFEKDNEQQNKKVTFKVTVKKQNGD